MNQNLTNSQNKLISTQKAENPNLSMSMNKIANENIVTGTKILEIIKDDKNNNNLSSLSEPHSNIRQETLITQLNLLDKSKIKE